MYPVWTYRQLINKTSREVLLTHYIFANYIQFLFPLIPITISCLASCIILSRSHVLGGSQLLCRTRGIMRHNGGVSNGPKSQSRRTVSLRRQQEDERASLSQIHRRSASESNKRYATVTIIFMTVQYIIFHIPYWVVLSCELVTVVTNSHSDVCFVAPGYLTGMEAWMVHSAIYLHTVVLNSTANSILYMFRIRRIRAYTWNLVLRLYNTLMEALKMDRKKRISEVDLIYKTTRVPSTRTPILGNNRFNNNSHICNSPLFRNKHTNV